MVDISIIAKSKEKLDELKILLKKYNLNYNPKSPQLIISYGGDGLFLIAERKFPKIPKVLIRDSKICNNCPNLEIEEILSKISKKEYKISELPKLQSTHFRKNKKINELKGINDIVIRNYLPIQAIRFKIKLNNDNYSKEFIGDGLVIATPFGSKKGTYFHTITKKRIKGKIGIAFNNVSTNHKNFVISFKDSIEILITRANGVLIADNNPHYIKLNEGDIIKVQLAKEKVKIVNFRI